MLEGYVLVLIDGAWFIGRAQEDRSVLQPAYEAHVRWMGDGQGNFGVLRECTPIMGSTRFNRIEIPSAACLRFYCEDMSGKEKEAWSHAINECDGLIQALKVAESGIVLPPEKQLIVK